MTMSDDDLIERSARAAYEALDPAANRLRAPWAGLLEQVREHWRAVARAVLFETAAQPPAPIAAEDVRAAERAWADCPRGWTEDRQTRKAAFVADYLNRRTEAKES